MLLSFDAFVGASIFISINQEEIYKELGIYQEYKKIYIHKYAEGLNCQGHITNLDMKYKLDMSNEAWAQGPLRC